MSHSRVGLGSLCAKSVGCGLFSFRISLRNTKCKRRYTFGGRIVVGMGSEWVGIACVFEGFHKKAIDASRCTRINVSD